MKKFLNIKLLKCREKLYAISILLSAPVMISKRQKLFNKFSNIGSDIGLLFQITDDLIDYRGIAKNVGKRTRKDKKRKSNFNKFTWIQKYY